MHEAVRCSTVISAPGLKLETAEQVSESCILATTSDGTLLSLKPDGRDPEAPWQVVEAIKNFSRKPISCLRHLGAHEDYMLTMADDGIGLFQLSSLDRSNAALGEAPAKPQLKLVSKTKYPTCFCVNRQETLLCVCTKKKLLIYQWFEGEFAELQDFPINETIRKVEWCGEYLLVAHKKDYQLFNLSTGSYTEVIPTGKSNASSKILLLPTYNELMLLKDNVGVFVGLDGKLTRKFGVTWSEHPAHVQVVDPYSLAVFDNFIEVRSLHRESSYAVAQTISLKNISFVSKRSVRHTLLVGSQSAIYRVARVPLLDQINQLGKNGAFEEGLRLCDSISDEDEVWRLTKSGLHQRYGWALFARKMYTEAIRQFSLSSKSPRHVLRLYPSVLPHAARVAVQSLPKLTGLKDCRLPDREEATDVFAFKALLPYLIQQRRNIVDFAKEKKEVNRRNSFGVLENTDGLLEDATHEGWGGIDLLPLVDTAILHTLLVLEDWDQMLKFLQEPNHVDVTEAELVLTQKGHYIEVVLLYRQQERHREALAMLRKLVISPFDSFRVPPHETTINNLKGTNASIEYLLYLGRDCEDLVLEHTKWILQYDPQGAFRIFTYRFPSLGAERVLDHLREYGPELRIQYLEFLISKEEGGGGGGGGMDLRALEDKLAILLLDEVVKRSREASEGGETGAAGDTLRDNGGHGSRGTMEAHRKRLRELLLSCATISPEWILSQLPENSLLEERALVYRKLGDHKKALEIFIHRLGSESLAMEYCGEVYDAVSAEGDMGHLLSGDGGNGGRSGAEEGAESVYLSLVQILLGQDSPSGASGASGGEAEVDEKRLGKVLTFLMDCSDRIDAVRLLSILPGSIPLSRLLAYLKVSFSGNLRARKQMSVLKSLTKQEALQYRSELISHQKQSVVVTPESVCRVCYKRIQNSVFVVDEEDGRLVHFVCHRRAQASAAGRGRNQ